MKAEKMVPNKACFTPAEAAGIFCVSRATVYNWINAGKLRAVKFGDDRNSPVRIPRESVLAKLTEGTKRQPAADKNLLTIKEAARESGFDFTTVYGWCRHGRIRPTIKDGKLFVSRDSTEKMSEGASPSTPKPKLRRFLLHRAWQNVKDGVKKLMRSLRIFSH